MKLRFVASILLVCILLSSCSSRNPSRKSPTLDDDAYEIVCNRLEDCFWNFPYDALSDLEAYIYQYTDDYDYVSQSEAEEAYETIRRYCYSFYDVLD